MKRYVRAQSMVEMALILPFLTLFVIGLIEVCFYIYAYSELENATRRGSEWAANTPPWTPETCDDYADVNVGCGGISSVVRTRDQCAVLIQQHAIEGTVLMKLKPQNIVVTYVDSPPQRAPRSQIQVQVTYTTDWLTPIGRRMFGNKLNFNFVSRRTILNTDAPTGRNPDCSVPTS